MLFHWGTSLLLVALTLTISFLWQLFCFFTAFNSTHKKWFLPLPIFPALLLTPLCIAFFHRQFGINLFFPSQLNTTLLQQIAYCLLPSFLLFTCSGLAKQEWQATHREVEVWRQKLFVLRARAFGLSTRSELADILIVKTWLQCLRDALPWLFCELIVLESLFNAPGLGASLWHRAKIRDIEGSLLDLFSLAVLYAILHLANASFCKTLGQKLSGYG